MVEKEFHELANIFPLMNNLEIESLTRDIKKNGLFEPIVLLDNKILDGRNRYLACRKAGIKPRYKEFQNHIEPLSFVLSGNLYRRHLNTAQKCELGLSLLDIESINAKKRMKAGKKNPSTPEVLGSKGRAITIVSKKIGVGHNTLRQVKKIKELIEINEDSFLREKWQEVKDNKLSIKRCYEIAKLQQEMIQAPVKKRDLDMKFINAWKNTKLMDVPIRIRRDFLKSYSEETQQECIRLVMSVVDYLITEFSIEVIASE